MWVMGRIKLENQWGFRSGSDENNIQNPNPGENRLVFDTPKYIN